MTTLGTWICSNASTVRSFKTSGGTATLSEDGIDWPGPGIRVDLAVTEFRFLAQVQVIQARMIAAGPSRTWPLPIFNLYSYTEKASQSRP